MPSGEEKFQALLESLQQLAAYLHERGEQTLAMSKRFEEHARTDPANREFDQRQATMLDYQHHVWHEIGNLVEKLIKQYDKA
jgi:hypothetical protein